MKDWRVSAISVDMNMNSRVVRGRQAYLLDRSFALLGVEAVRGAQLLGQLEFRWVSVYRENSRSFPRFSRLPKGSRCKEGVDAGETMWGKPRRRGRRGGRGAA